MITSVTTFHRWRRRRKYYHQGVNRMESVFRMKDTTPVPIGKQSARTWVMEFRRWIRDGL